MLWVVNEAVDGELDVGCTLHGLHHQIPSSGNWAYQFLQLYLGSFAAREQIRGQYWIEWQMRLVRHLIC